jgi:prepilin-type processing-associated H-X9-DG protein
MEVYVGVGYPWDPTVPMERQQFSTISPTRHGRWGSAGSVNVLFFDGHVQSVSAREVYYAFGDPMRSDPP